MGKDFDREALSYHRFPRPGKIMVLPTKPLNSKHDMYLAYSHGVTVACNEIVHNPEESYKLTSRGNLVAIISNGSAIPGLGNAGPLASNRGALDVGATEINEAMKRACIYVIAELAREELPDEVAEAWDSEHRCFGSDYLVPLICDPRLILRVAPAVAQAAMDSGVARWPITDMNAYRAQLHRYVQTYSPKMRWRFNKAINVAQYEKISYQQRLLGECLEPIYPQKEEKVLL